MIGNLREEKEFEGKRGNMTKTMTTKKYLTLTETAAMTGLSVHHLRRVWPEWKDKYNVRIFKAGGKANGHLLFESEGIENMIATWEVV